MLSQRGDAKLASLIAEQKEARLTAEDLEVIANIPRSMNTHQSILVAIDAMRNATDAEVAMIGHTTFGAPLAEGPLTSYDFNAFVRFGGGLKVATVSADTLAQILTRASQFTAETLDARTGDYVHVAEFDLDSSKSCRLAVNGRTAVNQKACAGTEDLAFGDVPDLELKAVVAAHLRSEFP